MFWGGALAGVTSAGITHQLDVMKVLRQVGQPLPEATFSNIFGIYFLGITMGCVAQGARFAVTLLLNSTLQKKLDEWEKNFKKGSCQQIVVAFCFSMLAGGIGEAMTNPFGVIKNYQIANNCGMYIAFIGLWEMGWANGGLLGAVGRFFSGVGFGVLRKSLANGIMLQTINPCKTMLKSVFPKYFAGTDATSKSALGFVAGSLTGAFAEVMTNHPDQVKAMTQIGVPFFEALITATKNPFRGAIWAGIRKGGIRGINWGCLEVYMGLQEKMYRRYRKMAAAEQKDPRISEFTRETTPM